MYGDQGCSSVFVSRTRQEYLRRDIDNDSDGAHMTSFGIDFQTEEEAKTKMNDHQVLPY